MRVETLLAHGGTEVISHPQNALKNSWRAFRIVLEVAEHLSEILGPRFQLLEIVYGYAQHLGSNDARQRFGQVGNYIHAALTLDFVEQTIRDLAEHFPSDLLVRFGQLEFFEQDERLAQRQVAQLPQGQSREPIRRRIIA